MKKVYIILALLLTLAILCSCSGYVKSYSATILITSHINNEASMEFDTFKGTYNFKLEGKNASDHALDCEASIAEGEMKVYIGVDGEIVCDYLNPKKLLDTMRLSCRGKSEPIKAVYQKFNEETNDGRDMTDMSILLSDAITSIIDTKEESDIDSLFKAGGTTLGLSEIKGLDDFELICFLAIR